MHVSDFKFTSSAITEERCCKYAMPLSNNPVVQHLATTGLYEALIDDHLPYECLLNNMSDF